MRHVFAQNIWRYAIQRMIRLNQSANTQTIYYCYRMLLGRAPEHEELHYWKKTVRTHHITVDQLMTTFETSEEAKRYRRSLEWRITTDAERYYQRLRIEDFYIYVATDDNFVGLALARDSRYEPEVTNILKNILKSGGVFVDIGANIGYFTLLAAQIVGTSGRVFAFEPNKRNCALLWLSSTENNYQNIEVFPVAASHNAQNIVVQVTGSNGRIVPNTELFANGISASTQDTILPPNHVSARTVEVDTLLHDVDRIDVIKIDVEGAEPFVLAGMQAVIQKHRPIIITEFSPAGIIQTTQQAPEGYVQQLRKLGYDLHMITKEKTIPLPAEYYQMVAQFFSTGNDHIDIICYPNSCYSNPIG
jgi:FkbM family methyltransferase